ncbi:MAG TPA: hypothetical protein VNN80_28205 [Polyangiaceae bacterium]|nr:hypothetical protein [Polyangiaceae bacterium]
MSRKSFVFLGLFCGLLACGDDDEDQPGVCDPVVACGGNVVGSWEVQSFCLPQDAAEQALANRLPAQCNDAFVSAEATPNGVTRVYSDDGIVTTTGSIDLRNEYRFTTNCLSALSSAFPNLETACQRVIAGNFSGIEFEDPGRWTLSCTSSDEACDCDAVANVDITSSGTYTLLNDQVIVGDTTAPYCVDRDELTITIPEVAGDAVAHRM